MPHTKTNSSNRNLWTAPPAAPHTPAPPSDGHGSMLVSERLGYLMQSAKNLEANDARIERSVHNLQADVDNLQESMAGSFAKRKDEQDAAYRVFSERLTNIEQRLKEDEAESRGRWAVAKIVVSIMSGAAGVIGWAVGMFLKQG